MSIRNPFESTLYRNSSVLTANPAAGANLSIPTHLNALSELLNLSFQLATDGSAANRSVYIELHRATHEHRIGSATYFQVASKTFHYICAQAGSHFPTGSFIDLYIPIASLPVCYPGDTIEIIVDNIQATDAITTILSLWKIWPYEAI